MSAPPALTSCWALRSQLRGFTRTSLWSALRPIAKATRASESIPMGVLVADLLGDHHQQQEQRSRPHRVPSEAPAAAQAERNAAWLVAFAQKGWRKRNGRKRVPGVVTNEMIKVAIQKRPRRR